MGRRLGAVAPIAATLLFACLAQANQKSRKVAAIDSYCQAIEAEFRQTRASMFAGPEPWTELTEVPASLTEGQLAYVYSHAGNIRWVFLREMGSDRLWSQDINYFFRQDGTLAKRVRYLSTASSNVNLVETGYYQDGELLKENTSHKPLGRGREDSSTFEDHEPPLYWTTDDLPFADIETGLRLAERLIQIPNQIGNVLEAN